MKKLARTLIAVMVAMTAFATGAIAQPPIQTQTTAQLQARRAEIQRKFAEDDFGVYMGPIRWFSHGAERNGARKELKAIDNELARRKGKAEVGALSDDDLTHVKGLREMAAHWSDNDIRRGLLQGAESDQERDAVTKMTHADIEAFRKLVVTLSDREIIDLFKPKAIVNAGEPAVKSTFGKDMTLKDSGARDNDNNEILAARFDQRVFANKDKMTEQDRKVWENETVEEKAKLERMLETLAQPKPTP
jgi:hypothetical protein